MSTKSKYFTAEWSIKIEIWFLPSGPRSNSLTSLKWTSFMWYKIILNFRSYEISKKYFRVHFEAPKQISQMCDWKYWKWRQHGCKQTSIINSWTSSMHDGLVYRGKRGRVRFWWLCEKISSVRYQWHRKMHGIRIIGWSE